MSQNKNHLKAVNNLRGNAELYPIKRALFLFSLLELFATAVNAGETSRGISSRTGTDQRPMTSYNAFSELKNKKICPPLLTDWVKDDFTDKSTLGFDFPSEAKSCRSSVKAYGDYLNRTGKKTSLSDAESLSTYLADRYTKISPNAKSVLSLCNDLPDGKDQVVKARYYMGMSKLEAMNSTVLDEVAYIDSVIPQDQGVKTIECNKIFPFPQVGKKCEDYKRMLDSGSCKVTQESRLDAMVEKTKAAMAQLQELEPLYQNCLLKKEGPCENIGLAIQIIKSDLPWIDGKKFEAKANRTKVNAALMSDKVRSDYIKKGIVDQLNANRKDLLSSYNKNLEQTKCLTSVGNDGGAPCSFSDTRNYLSQLPDVVEPQTNTQSSREFGNHVDAEKCMIERGMDRESTKKLIDETAFNAATMVLTGGLSAVAGGGLRVIRGLSAATKLKNAALANAALAGVNLSVSARQAVNSCLTSTENLLKFTGKPEVIKDSLCPESTSKFESTSNSNSSCMIDALLTAPGVWGMVKSLKIASQFSKFSNEDLLKMYKDPKQREYVEKILGKSGRLTDIERGEGAESLLGKKLTEVEKKCVVDSHYVAPVNAMRIGAASISDYSSADLLAKKSVLSACGFGSTEIALLMRAGITGNTPESALEFIRKSSVMVLGKDLTPAQVDAVWDASSGTMDSRLAILKKAGFSDEDAVRIANNDLNKVKATDVKAVVLGEQPTLVKIVAPKPVSAAPKTTDLLKDAFETQRPEKMEAAYKASRNEALASIKAGQVTTSESAVSLVTQGLKVEESASLLKVTAASDEGYKKTIAVIDQQIASNAGGTSQASYNVYQLQELKMKVMENHFTLKYNDRGSLDIDKFYDTDEKAHQAYSKVSEIVAELRKKQSKLWPK